MAQHGNLNQSVASLCEYFPESVLPSNNYFEMLGSSSGQVYSWLGGKWQPTGDVVDRIQKLVDVK
jgi:hypothetical protein